MRALDDDGHVVGEEKAPELGGAARWSASSEARPVVPPAALGRNDRLTDVTADHREAKARLGDRKSTRLNSSH